MSRLFISAAHKSSGKTTVSVGLCAAFAARGLSVRPFKKGPDYIDPLWLSRAAGHACWNLDFHTMASSEILATVGGRVGAGELALVEGNKGLHDGVAVDGGNSNAAVARLLDAPVVLVIDTRGMTRGIAPLVLGYQAFDERVEIAGVILNYVGGPRHQGKLCAALERYTDVAVLGAVGRDEDLRIGERHLGLVPANEVTDASATIQRIAARVAEQVDLDRLLRIAHGARPWRAPRDGWTPPARRTPSDVRIGIARDAAFGFYYPGDLDALRAAGAELVIFDTLRDTDPPDVDGLFIGGGFPEMHLDALEANRRLRRRLGEAVIAGLPVYAECGGLMYLARRIHRAGRSAAMVGAIPADVLMEDRPQGKGYVVLEATGKAPWAVGATPGEEIHAHEFHHSRLVACDPNLDYAYRVRRGHGVDGERDGIVIGNLLAGYAHLRDTGRTRWAAGFVDFVRSCRHELRRASG